MYEREDVPTVRRQRVLLLITNLGMGGAQRAFADQAAGLSDHFEIEEAVFDKSLDEDLYHSGNILHDLRRRDSFSRLGPIGRLMSRALALRDLVRARHIDLVISHMDGANWVNVLSASKARKILVVHGTVLHDRRISPWLQWIRRAVIFPIIYNFADVTVAVSDGIKRELTRRCGVRRVMTIQNLFDLNFIREKAKLPLNQNHAMAFKRGRALITSGRLTEQKGQSHLVRIMADLLKSEEDIRLIILGDGELRDEIVHAFRREGLKTFTVWDESLICDDTYDVYFFGYVQNPYQYLSQADLFLFPSGWEGFPLALCEALIVGLPVMSTDCPTGPREILAPGTARDDYDLRVAEIGENGVLLPSLEYLNSSNVWVEAIQLLLSDQRLLERLANAGKKTMQKLDKTAVLGRWRNLIENGGDHTVSRPVKERA